MRPHFTKRHNRFTWEGYHLDYNGLVDLGYFFIKEGGENERSIGEFLLNWLDERDFVYTKTSGSTGKPKQIKLSKQAMVNSALATGDALGLMPGQTCLLCLPASRIAGKMMLVRAMILGLELHYVQPSRSPLRLVNRAYDFCAMTPMQLKNSLNKINLIGKTLVGGGAVDSNLKSRIISGETEVFETFGMTETLSHIALKALHYTSSRDMGFRPLENIELDTDESGCLLVKAPNLFDGTLITKDIVDMHSDGTFTWLGRADNVVNSGGVKLFPEVIEAQLSSSIAQPFMIGSEPHEELGEKLILIVEGAEQALSPNLFDTLDQYARPKSVYFIDAFAYTANGKLDRKATVSRITRDLKN